MKSQVQELLPSGCGELRAVGVTGVTEEQRALTSVAELGAAHEASPGFQVFFPCSRCGCYSVERGKSCTSCTVSLRRWCSYCRQAGDHYTSDHPMKPELTCSTCGGLFSELPCVPNPVTGKGSHTISGGCAKA